MRPIDGLFERRSRRTGFFGAGLPKERNGRLQGMPTGVLHEQAPFFMDFRSALRQNQATEDRVTLQEGRFAGGTTKQVSLINLTLANWFERDHEGQVDRLFSPTIDPDTVGPAGLNLEDYNEVESVDPEALASVAREHNVVGHAQKMAHLREDGRPPILRRDVNSDDNMEAGIVFVSLQRDFEDFRRLRLAMEGRELDGEGAVKEAKNNGILQYLSTRRRGNFLIPPREQRAFPS
ncbi:MAG: hypothetical protein U5K37_12995 [Natrialbaceae archaeon]|nr:hypothetical protein [Natrialbaceae archaeon]